jgi:hypothetical protein
MIVRLTACLMAVGAAACGDGSNSSPVDSTADGSSIPDAPDDAADAIPDTTPDTAADADSDDVDVDPVEDTERDDIDPDDTASVDADVSDDTPDVAPEPPPNFGQLPATVECTRAGDACGVDTRTTATYASYRKDEYFEDSVYNEYTQYPLTGGRVHIAGTATRSGAVTDVLIDGVSVTGLLAAPAPELDWYHVWPDPVVEGQPVWVAFHSREAKWDEQAEGRVAVQTADGPALDDTFPVVITDVPLTWVSTTDDGTELLVHLHNNGSEPVTVERLWVNGADAVAQDTVCGDLLVRPGQSTLLTVELCTAPELGSAWTVVAEYDTGAPAVGVGRTVRAFFPIEAWPTGDECAQPDGADGTEAFVRHLESGIDTFYYYWGGGGGDCGLPTPEVVNSVLPSLSEPVYALVGDDFLRRPNPETAITDTSRVAGFLTGDESDGELLLEDGTPAPEEKARDARRLWSMYPDLPVYNGGKTNGHVGAFAGMTDIQGMDLYVAGCAPHITFDPQHPPLRGAYDYLRNTRQNHMPQPTWLYAQGLHSGWNRSAGDTVIRRQPNPAEVWVQALSVIAAGGKGLMWFQTQLSEADAVPESWDAMTDANQLFRVLRTLVREGDPTGMATSTGDVIVEAIRSRDAIVVPVINLAYTAAPSDELCYLSLLPGFDVPEWILAEQSIAVNVTVPSDLAFVEAFELTLDGTVADAAWSATPEGRVVRLHDIDLSDARPGAVYVLTSDPTLRQTIADALTE